MNKVFGFLFLVAIAIGVITGFFGYIWLSPLVYVVLGYIICSVIIGVIKGDEVADAKKTMEDVSLFYASEKLREANTIEEDDTVYQHNCAEYDEMYDYDDDKLF